MNITFTAIGFFKSRTRRNFKNLYRPLRIIPLNTSKYQHKRKRSNTSESVTPSTFQKTSLCVVSKTRGAFFLGLAQEPFSAPVRALSALRPLQKYGLYFYDASSGEICKEFSKRSRFSQPASGSVSACCASTAASSTAVFVPK